MSNTIIGLILIDAPHSALNNTVSFAGDKTENIKRVKSITKNGLSYPYVSGQAFRYWLRETLRKEFDWKMSPVNREKKIAFTDANPIEYDDDDMFGYMRAMKKQQGGPVTRISPFKNSPLISVIGQMPAVDFGVMARQEEEPVPYGHEFYSTILKGAFSIDLDSVGVFCEAGKTGYKNMYPELIEIAKNNNLRCDGENWIMDAQTRIKRSTDVINALPYLYGGAKNTSHLTDVTPKIIVLTGINGGNHIFMNIVREENGQIEFDLDALDEVIKDYSDILKTDIYIGLRKGFLDSIQHEIKEYAKNRDNVYVGTIKEACDQFSKEIPKLI